MIPQVFCLAHTGSIVTLHMDIMTSEKLYDIGSLPKEKKFLLKEK